MEERTLLSAVTWTGNAGDNNWDTPANWSSSPDLPGAADDVTIDVSADVVHSSNVTDSIHSLTSSQPLTITGGTLSIATDSTISNTLTLKTVGPFFTLGTLNGAGNITVGGLLTLSAGTLGGTGMVTANGGIGLNNISSSGFLLDGKTLVNSAGQIATLTGGFTPFTLRDGASIVNNGAFVQQAGLGNFNNNNNAGAAVAFINNGSFTQSSASGSPFSFFGVSFDVNSPGTVDLASGEVDLQGGGASTGGGFTVESGATLGLDGTYTLDANSSINGAGTVGFGITSGGGTMFPLDANVTVGGSYNVTGTTLLGSATVNFNGPVAGVGSTLMSAPNMNAVASANFNTTFQGSAGVIPAIVINGGTVNFGTNPITATTLTFAIGNLTSGTVTGTADITVSGLTTLNDGQLTGTGTVTANGGIASNDSSFVIDGKTLVNPVGQTATFTGSGVDIDLENGASFINNGTFLAQCAGGFGQSNSGAATSFINNGSFIKSNPFNTFSFDFVGFNTTAPGTVDVQGGDLALAAGGTETGALFTIASGADLDFQGNTAFNLDAGTSFSGAGTLNFLLSGQTAAPPFVIPGNSPALTGPTRLNGGILVVNGSMPASDVAVASGGVLHGQGTVGAITSVGTVKPGTATATGILSANGNVRLANAALASDSFFQVALGGPDSGTGFDQLAVAGTADITDTTLNASLVNFTPAPGQKFPIITSTAPIVGTFVNLPEGAPLTISGVPFTISYVGGSSHNDIVLTQASTATATTTMLSSSANPSTPGQAVTFTATVAPTTGTGMPTGMVTFTIDTVAQQPVTLQDVGGMAQASLPTISNLAGGPHTITATYAGDGTFATSTATPLTQTVGTIATTTTLSSSADPSTPGQAVTFTAIVAPTTGTGMPTGEVTFTIDTVAQQPVALQEIGGVAQASLPTISNLANGPHTITATYSGDGTFATSTATPLTQTVATIATTTTLSSSLNPSTPGAAVTFTAIVAPTTGTGMPTGEVTFTIDTVARQPVALQDVGGMAEASLPTISNLTNGPHSIAATYAGNTTFATSTATPLTQTVSTINTTTTLSSSLNPSIKNQPVTFTATVMPTIGAGTPTGQVNFFDGTTPIGNGTLGSNDEATFTDSALAVGSHVITAAYAGDANFTANTSPALTQVVNGLSTTTTLSSSLNPSTFGQSLTFTAVVSATGSGTPTGSVIFTVDGQAEPAVVLTVVNGHLQATFATSTLAGGTHVVNAAYSGDSNFATSGSTPLTQRVNPAATSTTLVATPDSVNAGQPVTLTATVSGSPTPSGTVTFVEGTLVLGTATVNSSGVASLVLNTLTTGTHALTAVFGANGNFGTSTSNNVNVTVNASAPPQVVSLQRFGFHAQPTVLVLTFNTPLATGPAQDVNNYQIVLESGNAPGGISVGGNVQVTHAVYNPATLTVMLFTSPRLNVHDTYQLTVNGMTPSGLTGATGVPLAGAGNVAGTNYVATITQSTLAGPFSQTMQAVFGQSTKKLEKALSKIPVAALEALMASGDLSVTSILAARRHARARTHHHS